jgi:uncharacterized protein
VYNKNMITRIYDNLEKYLKPEKVLVIYGARRIGKTTLLKQYIKRTNLKYRLDSGDDLGIREVLSSERIQLIKEYASGYELIIIDEAQRIPNVGLGLKILVDNIPGIKVIATGSASFDLSQKLGEPLTGRANILTFFPVSQLELLDQNNKFGLKENKEKYLIFGAYPEVLTSKTREEKEKYLKNIVNSYLLKDILEIDKLKASNVIMDLLRLLAFQIGREVAHDELASNLGVDKKTVARYLDLLEKSFVLVNIRGYSGNLRSEITKKSKYYFLDNGIRNAVISNFNSLNLRNDAGELWENFIVIERLKKQSYAPIYSNNFFWRTYDQKEIDWVEEREGKLFGYEIKWGAKKIKEPKLWRATYKNAEFEVVNQENYLEFIT